MTARGRCATCARDGQWLVPANQYGAIRFVCTYCYTFQGRR